MYITVKVWIAVLILFLFVRSNLKFDNKYDKRCDKCLKNQKQKEKLIKNEESKTKKQLDKLKKDLI